jgi:HSP20 family protein
MADKSPNVAEVDMSPGKGTETRPAERTSRWPASFGQVEQEMQRMFDTFLSRRWARPWQFEMPDLRLPFDDVMPRIDVVDRADEVLVRADLPGVDKQDVDVSLGDGTLTIKATAHRESTDERGEYFRREITCGEICRTVALPSAVDSDGAKASFRNGTLEITLPKAEQAKRRQIAIR